jgi:hypothetical protein
MGTSQKVNLLRRIAKDYLSTPDSKRVAEVADLIVKVAEERNDLVHGLYVHDKDDQSPVVLTFSGAARIRSRPKKLTPRDLALLQLEMNHAADEMDKIRPLFPVLDKMPDEIAMLKPKRK